MYPCSPVLVLSQVQQIQAQQSDMFCCEIASEFGFYMVMFHFIHDK